MTASVVKEFPWWRRIPIHTKLQIGTALFALILMVGGGLYLTWVTQGYFDDKIKRDLLMLSEVIAENSRAAAAFSDSESAEKVLYSLKANEGIVAAAIVRDGKIIASYPNVNVADKFLDQIERGAGVYVSDRGYVVIQPIVVTDKEVGQLVLASDRTEWVFVEQQLRKLFLGLFAGVVILLLVIYTGLRSFITRPLSNLSEWAVSVARHKRFDALAAKENDDEIGQLVDSLNTMLIELEKQQGIITLNQRLTEEIQERMRVESDLREMRTKAEQANEAKTRFLANMSHEIRTPMNVIMGFIEIVLESPLNDEQRKHLTTVRRSANLLHGLLNDILDVSKLEEGKLQLERIPFSVRQVIGDILKTFEMKAREKCLSFGAYIDPNIQTDFIGDPLRLSQILINLVGNAIKFTEEGSVHIEVVKDPDESLIFSVVDTGIGIAADKVDYVFQNFAQADTSVSRKYGGSGLGTTISKQLVELMGGHIWVESEPDIGSTFAFRILLTPIEVNKPLLEVMQVQPTLKTDRTLNILVAEDVPENAELLKVRLHSLGHNVVVVENGEEAVAEIKAHDFDIVLMDIQMPIKDGLTATGEIRLLEKGRNIPILALTASVLKQNQLACQEAGMNGFVTKPVVFADLYAEMARVLEGVHSKVVDSFVDIKFDIPEIPGVDRARAAVTWQDKDSYLKNLILFARSHRDAVPIIRHSLRDGSVVKVRKILHALKGAAGNLALIDIHDAVLALSKLLHADDMTAFDEHLKALERPLAALVEALLPSGRKDRDARASVSAGFDLIALEKRIALLCESYRKGITADDLLMQVVEGLKMGGLSSLEINPVLSAVDDFEFERAITQLFKLLEKMKSFGDVDDAGFH